MKLSDLKVNTYAIILSVNIKNRRSRIRLLEMGLTPGTRIKVTKIAPFGGLIGIFFRGYELCISLEEASYILIDKINTKSRSEYLE